MPEGSEPKTYSEVALEREALVAEIIRLKSGEALPAPLRPGKVPANPDGVWNNVDRDPAPVEAGEDR